MSLISNLWSSLFPSIEGDGSLRSKERGIDASTRFAILGAVKASIFWMVAASILGFIASVQLHTPSYFGGSKWLTFGKLYPAVWNALVYGWIFNAAFACCGWIVARLGGRPVANGPLLVIGTLCWNVAVVIGLCGMLWGAQTPYKLLEFPPFASPFVFVAFALVGMWILLAFKGRAYRSAYASQWYVLAAVFAFCWVYAIAQTMLFQSPVRGAFQAAVAAWYLGNVYGLVIAPFALAVIYYLIPKGLGQHVVGYRQSAVAFWSWVAFSSCSGLAALVNGPFPAWIATVGVIASFGLLLPLSVFGMQFLSSLIASFSRIWDTVSMRFVAYAVVAFLVAGLLIAFGSLRGIQDTIQFSQFENGARFLFLAGFAGMAFTGCIYFMLPRLLNKEIPSPGMADLQFWIQGLGIFAISAALIAGGVAQGELVNESSADALRIIETIRPYLFLGSLGSFIFLCSSLIFAVSFGWMLLGPRSDSEKSIGLIPSAPELEYTVQ